MSTEEKYAVIFDLLAKAKEEKGLDSAGLHDEIKKELEAENKTFGTFLGLVESLQDIIPKEKQRFNAAIKALAKTSGLSRQNILESADNQLEGLGNVEKKVFSALAGFGDELRDMDSRLKKTKDELSELRKKIADLEKEEQEILGSMASWEKGCKVVEQSVRKVFTDIGAEITGVRNKIEQFAAEEVPQQPIPPPESAESTKRDKPGETAGTQKKIEQSAAEEVPPQPATPPVSVENAERIDAGEDIILEFPSKPGDSKWVKKCSLCGGTMDFYTTEAMWKCYNCGNEEPESASESTAAS